MALTSELFHESAQQTSNFRTVEGIKGKDLLIPGSILGLDRSHPHGLGNL